MIFVRHPNGLHARLFHHPQGSLVDRHSDGYDPLKRHFPETVGQQGCCDFRSIAFSPMRFHQAISHFDFLEVGGASSALQIQ